MLLLLLLLLLLSIPLPPHGSRRGAGTRHPQTQALPGWTFWQTLLTLLEMRASQLALAATRS